MAKFECPFCDSAFLKFITSESELRQHVLVAHGRLLDFNTQTVKTPVPNTKDYARINLETVAPAGKLRCRNCGFELDDNPTSDKCPNCGNPVAK